MEFFFILLGMILLVPVCIALSNSNLLRDEFDEDDSPETKNTPNKFQLQEEERRRALEYSKMMDEKRKQVAEEERKREEQKTKSVTVETKKKAEDTTKIEKENSSNLWEEDEDRENIYRRNLKVRDIYQEIDNILNKSDEIRILSTKDGEDYLEIKTSQISTTVSLLSHFKYQIKYVQNYKCGKDIQKSELDKILFKKFSDLKILNEINETFPLDLDTDMVNSIYRVTLRARNIIRYRNSEVSDVWDDFNYFASQLDYSFSEIS
ncbi:MULTISPECIES: hypothetical protein [Acinetobacter]|uniref:hypothetical protein n=1 Tax=Acinetobacter TaxID=469 RepID=UPI000BD83CB3|nr:hypothetical protein [Acinetobacter sp. YT-02]PCN59324.1 hypothetical protein CF596_13800 [Acinetobacter sp. YT-02]